MKLFVDVGNTALKWRVRDGDAVRQGGCRHERHWVEVVNAIEGVERGCEAVWVASVAGVESDAAIAAALEQKTGVKPQFYYSCESDFGITSCYPEPRRLGVDRWVAMLECFQKYGAGIIVDCGSALTIDAVDREGRFLGGYIVPGLGMLRGALLRDTADVHVEAGAARLELGKSTGECVHNGLLRMSVAFVTEVVLELRQVLDDTCKVLITGGDAPALIDAFEFDYAHVPDLVLDGLERIAAEKE
ncbi:MAG: type III pantothenate kinase [Pseudomonadota bacterium]|uniref:type III pantothenate kinase n=1 Tax=Alcanivorax sp. TaxID=1872427 RepID=UPI002437E3EE|nr:type III pantothenate kinase [Alcanivorax sp.]MED5238394.1 type III pantothenate kinase [Pseudomonadota bacterium]MEE3320060.1 type III pantothenate kinase [Pseudomonadota bacterium]